MQKASAGWLASYSDNPLERPTAGGVGVMGGITAGEDASDIVDPNLAGFWSGGEGDEKGDGGAGEDEDKAGDEVGAGDEEAEEDAAE